MFPLWKRFWLQYSLLLTYEILKKLVTFMKVWKILHCTCLAKINHLKRKELLICFHYFLPSKTKFESVNFQLVNLFHTLSHTHTHTHTHVHTFSLSPSHKKTRTHIHTFSITFFLSRPHTHTHTLSLSLWLNYKIWIKGRHYYWMTPKWTI